MVIVAIAKDIDGEKEKKLWTITTIGDMLKDEVYPGKTIMQKAFTHVKKICRQCSKTGKE